MKLISLRLISILLFFHSLPTTTISQNISGQVFNENNSIVSGGSVFLVNSKTNFIKKFTVTDSLGNFYFSRDSSDKDSVMLKISSVDFITYNSTPFYTNSKDTFFKIILKNTNYFLEEVYVNSSKTWSKGDTTFFNVRSYSEGNEKKLEDILSKLPGLRISENGIAYYNGKPIEKILIDGQNIFEDKTGLLLKSFPIHVIENIQILEKQSGNKILKDLINSDKVFINVQLKKNRDLTVFGDASTAAGSDKRKFINSTVFSVANKLKLGLVSNFSSLSQKLKPISENEFKFKEIKISDNWLIKSNSLFVDGEIPSNYYLKNNLKEIHFKLNLPPVKNITNELEINYLKDNISQLRFGNEVFINNSGILERFSKNTIVISPNLLNFKYSSKVEIDSLKEFTLTFESFFNKSNSSKENFFSDNFLSDSVWSMLNNESENYKISISLLNRINKTTGYIITGSAAYINSKQFVNAYSKEYPDLFFASNDSNKFFNQNIHHKHLFSNAGIEFYSKFNKVIISHNVKLSMENVFQESASYVSRSKTDLDFLINDLSFNGKYKKIELLAASSILFNKSHKKFEIKYGLGSYYKIENFEKSVNKTPLINIGYSFKTAFSKRKDFVNILFSNSLPPLREYSNLYWPVSINTFNKKNNLNFYTKWSLGFDYFYSFKIQKHNINCYISPTLDFGTFASKYEINKTLFYYEDTFVKKKNLSFYANIGYSHFIKALKVSIEANLSFAFLNKYFYINNSLAKNSTIYLSNNISFKRTWKKIFLLQSKINSRIFNTKSNINSIPLFSSANFSGLTNGKITLNSNISFQTGINYYFLNLNSSAYKAFTYLDCGINYDFKNMPLSMAVNYQNVTNTKYLEDSFRSPLYESNYKVPFLVTNIYISASFRF